MIIFARILYPWAFPPEETSRSQGAAVKISRLDFIGQVLAEPGGSSILRRVHYLKHGGVNAGGG